MGVDGRGSGAGSARQAGARQGGSASGCRPPLFMLAERSRAGRAAHTPPRMPREQAGSLLELEAEGAVAAAGPGAAVVRAALRGRGRAAGRDGACRGMTCAPAHGRQASRRIPVPSRPTPGPGTAHRPAVQKMRVSVAQPAGMAAAKRRPPRGRRCAAGRRGGQRGLALPARPHRGTGAHRSGRSPPYRCGGGGGRREWRGRGGGLRSMCSRTGTASAPAIGELARQRERRCCRERAGMRGGRGPCRGRARCVLYRAKQLRAGVQLCCHSLCNGLDVLIKGVLLLDDGRRVGCVGGV